MIKRFIPFIFAGILGLVAVFAMQQVIQSERRSLAVQRKKLEDEYRSIQPIDVIVAHKQIPEGATITAEHLDKRSIPKAYIQPYAATRGSELLGMVAKVPIEEGEQIQLNKLRRQEDRPKAETLSVLTPKGMRAVTIGSDALGGVGGFVRPGDKVDILWTFQVPQQGAAARHPSQGNAELVTMALFQGIDVLAVANEMVGKSTSDQASGNDFTVTISLTPQQVSVLLFAREQGKVQLSLRPKTDKGEEVAVAPANMQALMVAVLGEKAVPPAPKPPRIVEVFKGLEKSVVAVSDESQ